DGEAISSRSSSCLGWGGGPRLPADDARIGRARAGAQGAFGAGGRAPSWGGVGGGGGSGAPEGGGGRGGGKGPPPAAGTERPPPPGGEPCRRRRCRPAVSRSAPRSSAIESTSGSGRRGRAPSTSCGVASPTARRPRAP